MTAAQFRVPAEPVLDSDPQLQRAIELLRAGRLDEAEFALTAAHACNPADHDALHFLAVARLHQGRALEAIDLVKRALKLRPHSAESLALQDQLLELNDSAAQRLSDVDYPLWNGEYVHGALLVSAAPSLGEQILYSSLVPDLASRADVVVLQVERRMQDLFARSFPAAHVAAIGTTPPIEVVAHVPMKNLAGYLRPDQSTYFCSDKGFLTPNHARAAAFRAQFAGDGCVVIGLSWRNQKTSKFDTDQARLRDFESVLRLANCRFVDLQSGDTLAERKLVERELGVRVEHLDDLDTAQDIDGLAALMTACDIVVTVSNTNAHLAGAVGRPTWSFLSCGPVRPWGWSEDRTDSPWYPHVRIKRQASGQSWDDLIAASTDEIW
jgi:hypothetical protein